MSDRDFINVEDGHTPRLIGRVGGEACLPPIVAAGAEGSPALLQDAGVLRADAWERLPGSYHGSGCTLASAVAGALVLGLSVRPAPVALAEAETSRELV